jgi:hypothetical protein
MKSDYTLPFLIHVVLFQYLFILKTLFSKVVDICSILANMFYYYYLKLHSEFSL